MYQIEDVNELEKRILEDVTGEPLCDIDSHLTFYHPCIHPERPQYIKCFFQMLSPRSFRIREARFYCRDTERRCCTWIISYRYEPRRLGIANILVNLPEAVFTTVAQHLEKLFPSGCRVINVTRQPEEFVFTILMNCTCNDIDSFCEQFGNLM